jgi:cell division septation protein DedD
VRRAAHVLKSHRLAPTQDEGFHEIQLNGKQLVFLFMAATVVSVVIFLMGVFVGRGVKGERGAATSDSSFAGAPDTLPQASAVTASPAPAGSDPTKASPPPAVDDLSYFNRLEKQSPAPEDLKPKSTPAPAQTPAPAAKGPAPASAPAAAANPPPGDGWAVQIAALNDRKEAEAIVKSLSSKGYQAYVVAPPSGTSVFRVRVGTFKTKRDAETIAAKLQKEEQFKPWVTR